MKTEQILELYLLQKKTLNLQGLGSFNLNPDIPVPQGDNTNVLLPANAVSFEYDPKIKEDNDLIDFMVLHSKKIKPLASADLDSYIALGKQFLNIGKPFIISGIGTLEKTQAGIEFKPGVFISPKIEAPKALKENEQEVSSGLFQDSQRTLPPNYDKRILTIIALVLVLGIVGWAIYNYGFKKHDDDKTESVTSTPADTSALDTLNSRANANTLNAAGDTAMAGFDIVIKTGVTKESAIKRIAQLKTYGRNAVMYTSDSISYTVAEPFALPLSDTLRVKDSLQRFYGKNIFVQSH